MSTSPELQEKRTLLHVAARNGNLEVVRLLLDQGANKEAADQVGLVRAAASLMCG